MSRCDLSSFEHLPFVMVENSSKLCSRKIRFDLTNVAHYEWTFSFFYFPTLAGDAAEAFSESPSLISLLATTTELIFSIVELSRFEITMWAGKYSVSEPQQPVN